MIPSRVDVAAGNLAGQPVAGPIVGLRVLALSGEGVASVQFDDGDVQTVVAAQVFIPSRPARKCLVKTDANVALTLDIAAEPEQLAQLLAPSTPRPGTDSCWSAEVLLKVATAASLVAGCPFQSIRRVQIHNAGAGGIVIGSLAELGASVGAGIPIGAGVPAEFAGAVAGRVAAAGVDQVAGAGTKVLVFGS